MTISERTLRKWRKEALRNSKLDYSTYDGVAEALAKSHSKLCKQILRLTQELLDQHLLRK